MDTYTHLPDRPTNDATSSLRRGQLATGASKASTGQPPSPFPTWAATDAVHREFSSPQAMDEWSIGSSRFGEIHERSNSQERSGIARFVMLRAVLAGLVALLMWAAGLFS